MSEELKNVLADFIRVGDEAIREAEDIIMFNKGKNTAYQIIFDMIGWDKDE